MLGLEYFEFAQVWSPVSLAVALLVIGAYLILVGPVSDKYGGGERVSVWRRSLFVCGVLFLYLAQAGPFELLGHILFSFHMVSMALSYLVAPPLLMLGVPIWVWRTVVSRMQRTPLVHLRFMSHPIVAAVIFNGLFSFYHIPIIHDYVMLNFAVHRLYYLVLFITSVLMWWSLVDPLPKGEGEARGLKKMGYIFLNMVLLTPACGLIIFASAPLYATYSDPIIWSKAMGYCIPGNTDGLIDRFGGPEFFGFLETKVDQQVGGIIMKFFQEFIFASMLAYVFLQWYKQENQDDY